ncbi:hypothetical protein MAR_034637, partial [Mya arenaria]
SGSIVCDYEVVCKGDVNLTILKTTTASVADPRNPLNFTFCKNCTATVNNTVLDQALTTAQNMRTSSACLNCKMGERCNVLKTFVRCYNPCKTTANGGCLNGGVCYFDGQENSTKCRCPSDEGRFVYSGEHCEIAVENLSLSSTYIAAIAGGTGGALIVVLRSPTKGGLRMSSDMYPRKREDTLTVEGKEHTSITDSRGNEVYMYQPDPNEIRRQPSSPVSSSERDYSRPRTASVYDYIDTESRYEIQRPILRLNVNRI